MTEAAHALPEVKDDDSDSEAETSFGTAYEMVAGAVAKMREDSGARRFADPAVSAAAVSAGARPEILRRALESGGFPHLGSLQIYLGGATVRHALTWLALRTQMFYVTD